MAFHHKQDIIGLFAQHKVAANLLMIMMILVGILALSKLNTQFFPSFALDIITVRTEWSGASAEDVENGVTVPMEQELRNLDNLHKISSTSATGVSSITLEYEEGTEMESAVEKVKSAVALVRNLPPDAEDPVITRVTRYEPIARVLVTGQTDLGELRHLAYRMRDELLAKGISKIEIQGLPKEEIGIQIPSAKLQELGLSLDQIAQRIKTQSRDLPAGFVGRADISRQLRSLDQRRSVIGYEQLPLSIDQAGNQIKLGEVATIERRPRHGETTLGFQGQPAVELDLQRAESMDALKSAGILASWLDETRSQLPQGIELKVFDQSWQLIKERITLLLTNGGGGLVLVIAILFLFLHGRVAFWVTMGIPVSFLAALAVLYFTGGTINMISLFGLIMALGIIVDDAIVVGEDALTHYQSGEASLEAAEGGARRMLAPVWSSSLTTIAGFVPLMTVGGVIGNIMFDIPLVVISVIIASLVECFLILPGHLRKSFKKTHHKPPSPLRQRLDTRFANFRDNIFRPMVTYAVDNRLTTISVALSLFILSIGLLAGGRINFTFFPKVEGRIIYANASFAAGTPPQRVDAFLDQLENTLQQTDKKFGGNLIVTAVTRYGSGVSSGGGQVQQGEQHGSIMVELVSPEQRKVRNDEFIRYWQNLVQPMPGLERFTLSEPIHGPPGHDIDIQLTGQNRGVLKTAAIDLADKLKSYPGVSAIEDDLPWGQEQLIYHLNPVGRSLNLSIEEVGRQLRAAYDGKLVQIFQDDNDEVEVRVLLPDKERHNLSSLDRLNISLPDGSSVPLTSVVNFSYRRGFEVLRHNNGQLGVHVMADVDHHINNSNRILENLKESFLPQLVARHGVNYSLEGRASDQAETAGDMKRGALFAFAMIYLVLAWVFSSYARPLIVMSIIPFGLIGAIIGHWVMGLDLTILSLFGLFGLSGIVVNDSIILVTFYQHLREQGLEVREAIIEAACQRLRAVLLTSLTTIGGLMPLLFETSLQAQFLIPMAATITFGLAFSTLLVLCLIPALLSLLESVTARVRKYQTADVTA